MELVWASEIMTIAILFYQRYCRNFEVFYLGYVCRHPKYDFPNLVSYLHFITLMQSMYIPLYLFLRTSVGRCTGIAFVSSTPLSVCSNKRIARYRVFDRFAK